MAFHVEIRQFPHSARKFNVERAELEPLLRGWVSGAEVRWGEREWQPRKARLAILEGPTLEPAEIGMGRGWPEAERRSSDVTAELLDASRAARPASDARPLVRRLIAQGRAGLPELVGLLGSAGVEGRDAEAAVWALLQAGELELVSRDLR